MIDADARLRAYEARVRVQRRAAREQAMWDQFNKEYGDDDEDEGGGGGKRQ